MSDNSKIEWTDATWNPVTGCSVVSPGCTNCYAMKLAGTRLKHHPSRIGLTEVAANGQPVWNGQVRLNHDWISQPLRWRKPRRIFVCAHGDLFHESVPFEWIDRVFTVMATTPWHTFQVLTKRPERMRDYVSKLRTDPNDALLRSLYRDQEYVALVDDALTLPLPNVWLGVSAENQEWAEKRIPVLLQTPAALRFVSAEPLLGPIDLNRLHGSRTFEGGAEEHWWESALTGKKFSIFADDDLPWPKVDWCIVGGESDRNPRLMDEQWAYDLRDQCANAGVAFFMKQMNRRLYAGEETPIPDDLLVREYPAAVA